MVTSSPLLSSPLLFSPLISSPLLFSPLLSSPLLSSPLLSSPLLSSPLLSSPLLSSPLQLKRYEHVSVRAFETFYLVLRITPRTPAYPRTHDIPRTSPRNPDIPRTPDVPYFWASSPLVFPVHITTCCTGVRKKNEIQKNTITMTYRTQRSGEKSDLLSDVTTPL